MKYVKNRFQGIHIYDTNANLFDLGPFKLSRGKMTRESLQAINAELAGGNPGKTFSAEFTAYPQDNLRPDPYGIIYKFTNMDNTTVGGSDIYNAYTVRDYWHSLYADIACREIMARYFTAKAQLQGIKGDKQGFENYRFLAEKTCPDNPGILSTIASAYFYGLGDAKKSAEYLEKAVKEDPYFMDAIRLLTRVYGLYDKDEALKWARVYVEREWDRAKVEEVKKEFGI
jgi:tetratricopeptide (TPR) repeat protein